MKKRIGIMGGTFDPIHIGHLIAAEQAREQGRLDEVWFLPTYAPPHKKESPAGTPEQRLEMVRRAVNGHPRFAVCDLEIRRGGISYSADTVEALTEEYPDVHFLFIIGADMVEYLPRWHRIGDIAARIGFIGLARPGYTLAPDLPSWLKDKVTLVTMPQIELSSSEIRSRVRAGRSIRYLVPGAVQEYIEENGLYV